MFMLNKISESESESSNHNMLPNCIYSAQIHNASIHCIVHHSVYTSIILYLYFNFFTHKFYPIININRIQ